MGEGEVEIIAAFYYFRKKCAKEVNWKAETEANLSSWGQEFIDNQT